MDERDDDLDSMVHEGAEEETESYPDTGDELNQEPDDQGAVREPDDTDLDQDRSKL